MTTFWAPFINRYAAGYKDNGIDLDKYLPSLYVYGKPGSGNVTFTRYAFHLLSNAHVAKPEDGDSLNKTNLTAVRVDSVFPVVFDDIDTNDLDIETYLNFRQKHWTGDIDIPALAFINIGKWMWEDAYERDLAEFQRRNVNHSAKFDDSLSVYSSGRKYARTLPQEARELQDGNQFQSKTEETVADWFPFKINENKGIISKTLPFLSQLAAGKPI